MGVVSALIACGHPGGRDVFAGVVTCQRLPDHYGAHVAGHLTWWSDPIVAAEDVPVSPELAAVRMAIDACRAAISEVGGDPLYEASPAALLLEALVWLEAVPRALEADGAS